MNLTVKNAFDWAHQGVRIGHFAAGTVIETEDPDLIEVSEREGWTEREGTRVVTPEPAPDPSPVSDPEPAPAPDPVSAPETAPAPTSRRKK